MENQDLIDQIILDWKRERPEIDVAGKGVVCRILWIHNIYTNLLSKKLKKFNLSPNEFSVLVTIRRKGEGAYTSQKEILKEVLMGSGAMTNLIDRLITRGFIDKTQDSIDKRGVNLTLTKRGLNLIDQAMGDQAQVERNLTEYLSKADVSKLENLLKKMVVHLDEN